MSDFNYIEYLKNNPLFKGTKTQSTKLITEAQEDTIDNLQKASDDTAKMPADRDKARNKMYAMKSKMSKSDLKAKIREEILSAMDAAPDQSQGLTAEEQEIQNSLKIAYDNAAAIGDQKLADQIGNSITFFTRTHIVER